MIIYYYLFKNQTYNYSENYYKDFFLLTFIEKFVFVFKINQKVQEA